MPASHSPAPPDATTPDTETLKRPTKSKQQRAKRVEELQRLSEAEPGSPTLKNASPATDNPPETFSTPATPPPKLAADAVSDPAPSLPQGAKQSNPNDNQGGIIRVDGIDFHHASEAEFARLLTYYGLEWQYEPNQFPLQWHEGRPTEMFSPDFYLPEYDLYIELTTMRQALVRRKNRKMRLLRALYPEINIKLLYRRDYQRLLERFGINPQILEAEQPPQGDIED